MKINLKILSIPPYISTAWKNVASLHVESRNAILILVVVLLNGTHIEIPGMDPGVIKAVFNAHANFIESEAALQRISSKNLVSKDQAFTFGFPLKADISALETMGPLLQHNPEQANGPDLPEELLQKISALSKTLGVKDSVHIPHPEPHCNCMHCQISKALHNGLDKEQSEEEIVTDEDLKFRTWDINKIGDKLYSVSNPFEPQENYSVFLGEPVGCTCGTPHCEHVRAVLNS